MAASTSSAATSASKPACKHLVLDAGPLLSLAPLRGLSEAYYTVPQVLDELKDKRAREHFERLGLSAGVRIEMKGPSTASIAHVIQWAKKTGDYAVLSHPDICVLALTYELDQQEKEATEKAKTASDASGETSQTQETESKQDRDESAPQADEASPEEHLESDAGEVVEEVFSESEEVPPPSESEEDDTEEDLEEREPLAVELQPIQDEIATPTETEPSPPPTSEPPTVLPPAEDAPVYDDPSDEDDGEGEWITPSNVALHKSRALDLLPGEGAGWKGTKPQETIPVGCMTADFAMQNVLLQMGLGLVGVEGKRIERVKSWVLRCHACFKICKDASRKFCPACGNPTLLRASVTISSPNAGPNTPAMQVHLKKNFQFKTRGTIFSIPAPKPGSAKTGPGEGLILREDQTTYMRAKKHADGKREREEKRMLNAATKSAEMGQGGTVVSSWMDPDWVPEILSTGTGGKGRSVRARGYDGDMPMIGYGRKNPNERRKKK
ncbi:20S-pre-rRNA D-site endonuclease nob1 [Trametes pubescens]|uniref:20S-pre-rRNA D-site endonuclease NOB1 n=1 Tax=Trametes pubescens TaxID=154538 RepID=A0A1M2VCN5_TRAPU|nr:20S-pre-rRNA D-site endonuclease nob1 [Trametes pubescens]